MERERELDYRCHTLISAERPRSNGDYNKCPIFQMNVIKRWKASKAIVKNSVSLNKITFAEFKLREIFVRCEFG